MIFGKKNAIILSGIAMCDDAVRAIESVVTYYISPYTITGGVPAKLIKQNYSVKKHTHNCVYNK